MKTKLFILTMLLAGQMFGQMTFDSLAINEFYVDPYGNYVDSKKEAVKKWTDYSAQLMSLAILEYAEECYQDSMAVNEYYYAYIGKSEYYNPLCPEDTCWGEIYTVDTWSQLKNLLEDEDHLFKIEIGHIHKQPSFPDFINWLKERK